MWSAVPVLDLELTESAPEREIESADLREVQALLRLHETPVGSVRIPVAGRRLDTTALREYVLDSHLDILARWALTHALLSRRPPRVRSLLAARPAPQLTAGRVSVVVCTRERPADLERCLAALTAMVPQALEIIVVDNAAKTTATREVVDRFPGVIYREEPRPGLDWARNRGVLDARGDIVAFADDDVIVDRAWAGYIEYLFDANTAAGAVTGLISPFELATVYQQMFEWCGGFGRGHVPKWVHHPGGLLPWHALGTGVLGSGANMAFRREVFAAIGLFRPELDTGTVTEGGGDLEMLYRVLKHGYAVAYDPRVMVWHRHRRNLSELEQQLGSWGVASFAMLESVRREFPGSTWQTLRYGLYWRRKLMQRVIGQFLRPARVPATLRRAEFRKSLEGRRRYHEARARVREIEAQFGPQAGVLPPAVHEDVPRTLREVARRSVDLAEGAAAIEDVTEYRCTRVYLHLEDRPLGHVDIFNHGFAISSERLVREMLENRDAAEWLRLAEGVSREAADTLLRAHLTERMLPASGTASLAAPARQCASVVLATCDRPRELQRCLDSLTGLRGAEALQIIVVDNHPANVATAQVVARYPQVVYVPESRRGLSYARNAGFARATHDIIICTDDDVVFAEEWLGALLAPFRRNDIDIVCGNVLPIALDTPSQCHFEDYGGLGKGYDPIDADQDWFFASWSQAVPTWNLGATANTAFRARLLRDPDVGLFEEVLGPGVPSGVGEDTYFFYRALLHGYRLRYEPGAVVWHEHRKTQADLARQLFAYSKGHVAYNLHTWFRHRDSRALLHLGRLAIWQFKRALKAIAGNPSGYPRGLLFTEIRGNLLGAWSLWLSHRVVRKRGRSDPLAPSVAAEPESGTAA